MQVDELKRSNGEAAALGSVWEQRNGGLFARWQELDQLRSALDSARWQAG